MIEIAPYNPQWPKMFEDETSQLKQALGDNCIAIHHIGSTSVPGLSAKPKIDIIAVIKNPLTVKAALAKLNYKYKGEYNIPFRLYFTKEEKTLKVNLHVFEKDNPEIELNLLFRDYLRSHNDALLEYENLKIDLLQQEPAHQKKETSMFTGYNLGKNDFIQKVLKLAGFNGLCFRLCTHDLEWDHYHRIRKEQIFDPINVIYDPNHPTIHMKHHYHFILYKGVDIVTVAHVEFLNSNEVALRALATDESYKRNGFGTYIIQKIEKWLKNKDAKIIKLHASLNTEQ